MRPVNGAPFYVMDFVDGRVVRGAPEAEALTIEERRIAGESIVDVLAAIHAVDVDAVGLGDLGKKESYIERQLKRWYGQFQGSDAQVPGGLDLPSVHEAHDTLASQVPDAGPGHDRPRRLPARQLHARPPTATISAVLDWEICTLGDPLADLGLLCVYWADADGQAVLPQASPTAMEGFPGQRRTRDALRRGVRPRRLGPRLLRRVRILEAHLHHRRRVRPLRRRRDGRRAGESQVAGFRPWSTRSPSSPTEAIDRIPT